MKTRLLIAAVAPLALLAACATPTGGPGGSGPAAGTTFRPTDFTWATQPGRGGIQGRLAYRQGQMRFTCAGAGVVLTPETPWTRRRMTILYKSPAAAALPVDEVRARTPSAPNDDYSAFVRRTTCDANDQFSFSGLPDGGWFVIGVARPPAGANAVTMAVMRRVEIRGGRMVDVNL